MSGITVGIVGITAGMAEITAATEASDVIVAQLTMFQI